jgi:hypothetical protein
MVALRASNLVRVEIDPDLVVLGMLADQRDALGRGRTQTINRLHRSCWSYSLVGQRDTCPRVRLGR